MKKLVRCKTLLTTREKQFWQPYRKVFLKIPLVIDEKPMNEKFRFILFSIFYFSRKFHQDNDKAVATVPFFSEIRNFLTQFQKKTVSRIFNFLKFLLDHSCSPGHTKSSFNNCSEPSLFNVDVRIVSGQSPESNI